MNADREAACLGCNGERTIIDPISGNEEPYTCPDCGGSGRAENSMTTDREALKAKAEKIIDRYEYESDLDIWHRDLAEAVLSLLAELEAAEAAAKRWAQLMHDQTIDAKKVLAERDQLCEALRVMADVFQPSGHPSEQGYVEQAAHDNARRALEGEGVPV